MLGTILFLGVLLAPETDAYLKLLSEAPSLAETGSANKGEIELLLDPAEIAKVEQAQAARWERKGYSPEEARSFSRIGIIAEDPYWIWLRDGVLFPSGTLGTYERILWKCDLNGRGGVAVLPILPDGKVLLNLNYRHATRSWEWEMARGGVKAGEGSEAAALREVAEETGWRGGELRYLGSMAPDAGCLGSIVPVYSCKLLEKQDSSPDDTEAIEGCYAFTLREIREGYRKGSLRGHPLRDPFLTYALYIAQEENIMTTQGIEALNNEVKENYAELD